MFAVRVACIYAPLIGHASLCSALALSFPVPATLPRSFRPERQCCCSQEVCCADCTLRAFARRIDSLLPPRCSLHAAGVQVRLVDPAVSFPFYCIVRAASVYAQLINILFSFPVPGTLPRAGCICIHAGHAVRRVGTLSAAQELQRTAVSPTCTGDLQTIS
ncbi:hypothetical protein C8R44DRAFT_881430 [Mycena epipterygia]|nr:hypothetical protein C8R44DRAFT_881430 [Mycena epipterygia]